MPTPTSLSQSTLATGRFITLEGGEGSGKSTNLTFLAQYLEQQGIRVKTTREPGGTAVGESIRDILLNPAIPDIQAGTEALLLFAARYEHLQTVILPALQDGLWVLCDRFTDASYAYQGHGRGLGQERIHLLEQWVQAEVRPDHTLLFDLDAATGLKRTRRRLRNDYQETDRIERETLTFFEQVRKGYQQQAQCFPERFHIIQAEQSLEAVQQQLVAIMQTLLPVRSTVSTSSLQT